MFRSAIIGIFLLLCGLWSCQRAPQTVYTRWSAPQRTWKPKSKPWGMCAHLKHSRRKLLVPPSSGPAGLSFQQHYLRGKIFLKQRLCLEAAWSFQKAIQTPKGRRHFAAHYYRARTYYLLGHPGLAFHALQQAKPWMKKSAHRQAYRHLSLRIQHTFGQVDIEPHVDPDEIGRLRLLIKSHTKFKRQADTDIFVRVKRQLRNRGLRLPQENLVLPLGRYTLTLPFPMCRNLSLGKEKRQRISLEVRKGKTTIHLLHGASCRTLSCSSIRRR